MPFTVPEAREFIRTARRPNMLRAIISKFNCPDADVVGLDVVVYNTPWYNMTQDFRLLDDSEMLDLAEWFKSQ